jgi:tetratricopeptide (TPR) repeat protein
MIQFKPLFLALILLLMMNFTISSASIINQHKASPDSTNHLALLTKAKHMVYEYKLDSAIYLYEKIYKSDTTNIETLKELETLYSKTSQYNVALNCINNILKIQPDNKHYFIKKGILLNKLKEHSAAIEIFKTALKNDSTNTYLITQIADNYRETNQVDSAYYYYGIACEIKPITTNLIKCADLLLNNRWNKGAMTFIERYYSPEMHKSKVLQRLYGKSLYLSDSIVGAYNVFHKLYTEGDSSKLTTKFLGLTYWKCSYYRKAEKVLENYIQKDTTDFIAYYVLGTCCQKINKVDDGIKYLNKSLALYQLNPDNTIMIYKGLAAAYAKNANYTKAIEYYSLIAKEDPTNIYGEYKIAMLYDHEIENKQKALECYNKLLVKMKAPNAPPNEALINYCQSRVEEINEDEFWSSKKTERNKP